MTERYSLFSSSGTFCIGSMNECMRGDLRAQLAKWVYADPGRLAYDMNFGRERMLCIPLRANSEQMLWASHLAMGQVLQDINIRDTLVILPMELVLSQELAEERCVCIRDRVLEAEVTSAGFSAVLLRVSNKDGLLYSGELTR